MFKIEKIVLFRKRIIEMIFLILFNLFDCSNSFSQCVVYGSNLIANNSFENVTANCGTNNQLFTDQTPVTDWWGTDPLSYATSTPDLGARNGSGVCGSSLNATNSTCFSGDRCVGVFVKTSASNTREYFQSQLLTPLTSGKTYCFSMVVRSRYGAAGNKLLNTNGIGAWFHNQGFINIQTMNGGAQFIGPGSILNAAPQVEASSIITDVCTTISGTFVSNGTENYIVVGNFKNDANTSTDGSSSTSYIYVDNLQLYEVEVALPIVLGNYEAFCDRNFVTIEWQTLSEDNNEYFELEKSCDGIDFYSVAIIEGAVYSTHLINYEFVDISECSPVSYYRLSQVDLNGNREVFKVLSINCERDKDVKVYPNPLRDKLTVYSGSNILSEIQIIDIHGRVVFIDSVLQLRYVNQNIDLKSLSRGTYFFKCLKNENQIFVEPIIIE